MTNLGSDRYAVLTGDVVNSTELEGYGDSLDRTFGRLEQDYPDSLVLGVDRYAGDTFQILLYRPQLSLKVALYIFTKLVSIQRSTPVRISIGMGNVESIPEERVSTGEGTAFRISGENLGTMKKYQRIMFEASENILDRDNNTLLKGSMDLLSGLMMKLSPAQAEAVWYKLKGYTQQEIATATDRKQQSVSDISIAGYWRNIEGFLRVFEHRFEPG